LVIVVVREIQPHVDRRWVTKWSKAGRDAADLVQRLQVGVVVRTNDLAAVTTGEAPNY
jgi:hypothetical protein